MRETSREIERSRFHSHYRNMHTSVLPLSKCTRSVTFALAKQSLTQGDSMAGPLLASVLILFMPLLCPGPTCPGPGLGTPADCT